MSSKQIFASIEEQRTLVEQATSQTKLARREQERTIRSLHGAKHMGKLSKEWDVPATELEDVGPILPFSVEEWST